MLTKIASTSPHKLQRIKIIAIPEGVIVISMPLKIDPALQEKGVSCKSINCRRALPEIKAISYLASYLSHEQATKLGHYDAILTDKQGEVYEGAYSNIFWFEGKTLCTRKEDVLPGITAQTVAKISPFKLKFKTINIKELVKKNEVFLTQSTTGIIPVTKIDGKKIANGKPGEKTQELIEKFNELFSS